jgi:VanZ family protein
MSFASIDKVAHIFLFFVLTTLWFWAKSEKELSFGFSQNRNFLMFAAMFGLFIELVQSSKAIGRSFEWDDLLADIIGVALAILLLSKTHRMLSYLKIHFSEMSNVRGILGCGNSQGKSF